VPSSSTRQWSALALGVLCLEMFLTTPGHALATAPASPSGSATSPEGQVPPDLAAKPSAAVKSPDERPPPDHPDIPAAPSRRGPGGELRLHGGVHAPVVGAAISFDWAFRRAGVGLGVDYAAWISAETLRVTPGALHVFAVGIHRVPLGRINLRQRLAVGPAIALEAIGTRKVGNTGLFFEVAPLGLEIQTRVRRLAVTFDAFSLAISAPVVGKDTHAVFQYRVALGLRF